METIVVQPSNGAELKLLKEFLHNSSIKNRILNEEDKEDFVLGIMMQETDYNKGEKNYVLPGKPYQTSNYRS